jgi:hypothetical protein
LVLEGSLVEKPSSAAFDMGKFAFRSDALKDRDSSWIKHHARWAGQLPPGDERDRVLKYGRVKSLVGGPWPSSGDKRKAPA